MSDYSGRRDVGNVLINIGSTLGQIYVKKLEASEKSSARARWYGQLSKIDGLVSDNINSPEMILSEFDEMQEKAHKDVVGSTRTPGARNQIEAEFEVSWASARNSIVNKTKQLIEAKSVADYKVNMATLTEAPPEGSVVGTDWVIKQVEGAVTETHEQFKAGNLTGKEQEYAEKQAAIKIFGHWARQQALIAEDPEKYLRDINKTIREDEEFKEKRLNIENLFSGPDVAELRADYKAINAQDVAEMKARAEAVEIEISNDIIKATDPNNPERLSYSEIKKKITQAADNGVFTDASQVRELQHFLEGQVKNAGKESDQLERGQKRNDIYDLIDAGKKDKAKKLWRENAWLFTSSDNDEINDDIRGMGTMTTDVILTDSLTAEGRFTTDYKKTLELTDASEEDLANLETNSIRRREQIRKYFKEHPDDTPDQKADAVEAILAPAKEELAKEIVKQKWYQKIPWWAMGTSPWYPANLKKAKSQYKPGDTRTVNGVTYTYDGQFWKD